MPIVISVDVEDWPQSTWDHSFPITERAARSTEKVLEILAGSGKKATFFVLGQFAEKFPCLIKGIKAAGHEVASHGHGHIEIFRQSPEEFRADVSRGKNYLEDLLGQLVIGYRAPDFSIRRTTTWALQTLSEVGFKYDSSIYPIVHKRYGIPQWPAHPVEVRLPSGQTLVELPIATIDLFGRRWPVAGGGYHRLLPWFIIRWAARRSLRCGEPFVSYCHPYEFDPGEFNSLAFRVPLKTRLHQGLGRGTFQAKFEKLLTGFEVAFACDLALKRTWPEFVI